MKVTDKVKYYITSDTHGFYDELIEALQAAGYFDDTGSHKLVILGDLMDRGYQAEELQNFVVDLIEKDEIILIRGNHEDLFVELATVDQGLPYSHHLSNETYDTALQLTGYSFSRACINNDDFAEAARETPFYKTIIPAMKDYFETANYVFTHGWIPCIMERDGSYSFYSAWREASREEWASARWYNGIDAARTANEDKTVICGHWHTSYGHSKYEGKGSEFGEDADFSPYYGLCVIAIDACTDHSEKVNVIVIED